MVTDNFDLLRGKLMFSDKGDFYIIFIILRSKDIVKNPTELGTMMSKNSNAQHDLHFPFIVNNIERNRHQLIINRILFKYYIYSLEAFDEYRDEIITLCNLFGARAYMLMLKQNNYITWEALKRISQSDELNDKCIAWTDKFSLVSDTSPERQKMLDLDGKQVNYKEDIKYNILKENFLYEVKTPNGCHLVYATTPETDYKLNKLMPGKIINMVNTVLYYNDHKDS